ncbi:MAG: beta family protein [Actinomycetota bacterium]|nr:beta family protein [Actinomycetota bacterium]
MSLAWGPGHYVPAVQFRTGELRALSTASSSTWAGLTPLVSLVGPKTEEGELTASRIRNGIKRIAAAVGNHPFYLDTIRLKPDQRVKLSTGSIGKPALDVAYAEARKQELVFVPVLRVGRPNAKICEIVQETVWQDGSGAALKYPILSTIPTPPKTHAILLKEILEEIDVEPSAADLILDLGYLSPDDVIQSDDAASLIDQVAQIDWRNIILLATGMPPTLSCIEQGKIGSIDRPEWKLWQALREVKIARMPIYGDYAIQHPTPPKDGGPGMRANIRYTTRRETIIVRGEGDVSEKGKMQYIDLCRKLIATSHYKGSNYSWGDQVIQDCADGIRDPENQALWRGVGTSHHFRVVTEQLSEFGSGS